MESQIKNTFNSEFLIINNTYREYQKNGDS